MKTKLKTKFRWYKYRTTWSHGYAKWEYVDMPYGWDKPRPYFDNLCNEHNWSEHFRGIQWKKIKSPPPEYMDEKIKDLKRSIKSNKTYLKELEKERA